MILNYTIVLLSAIAIGMIFGIIVKKNIVYRGPHAKTTISKLYVDKNTSKIYKLFVVPQKCPTTFSFLF